MLEGTIKLPERLMAVSGFIEKGACVVDIGTDHGYLPVYLAQNGLASSIVASDISAGSLDSARRSAAKYGVSDKITFTVAPGLSGVGENETDTVVISGLGGETIADILKDAPWTKNRDISLILQPQSKIVELCNFLRESGYSLLDAKLTLDSDRFYVIMLAAGGISDSILAPEIELYARLIYRRDPLFPRYMDDLAAKTRRALNGMKKSGTPGFKEYAKITYKLATYKGLKEKFENADSK